MENVSEERLDYMIRQFEDLNEQLDVLLSLSSEIRYYSKNIDKFSEQS